VHRGTHYSVEDLVRVALDRRAAEQAGEASHSEPRVQEYEALTRGREPSDERQEFVCVRADTPSRLVDWFDSVMVVKRLRELRALRSFSRVMPPSPSDPPDYRGSLSLAEVDWLPAMEVRGEGVFLELSSTRLAAWERRPEIAARCRTIDERYAHRFGAGRTPDRRITPRLLLIHTFAHALINQWSLDGGYSAAGLRERLFVSDDMRGLLVFTGSSDSGGSLGGIVAQADPGRLELGVIEALQRAEWCASDPLCSESVGSGVDSLNLAACHSCMLLPEVSCEEMNVLLDRALLTGTVERPDLGFFRPLLDGPPSP